MDGGARIERDLYRCDMSSLESEVHGLVRASEKVRAALCQALAIAYLRIDNAAQWRQWCLKHITKPSGESYSAKTIESWVRLGLKPDVRAAWNAARCTHNHANRRRDIKLREAVRATRVIGPAMTAEIRHIREPISGEDISDESGRQFAILWAAWHAANEAAREKFLAALKVRGFI